MFPNKSTSYAILILAILLLSLEVEKLITQIRYDPIWYSSRFYIKTRFSCHSLTRLCTDTANPNQTQIRSGDQDMLLYLHRTYLIASVNPIQEIFRAVSYLKLTNQSQFHKSVMFVGAVGAGKSTLCNSLREREQFETDTISSVSVTREAKCELFPFKGKHYILLIFLVFSTPRIK